MKNTFKLSLLLLAGTAFVLLASFRPISVTETSADTNWAADVMHTSMKFSIKHMGIANVEGEFKVFEGSMQTDGDSFDGGGLNFTVDVGSVNTGNQKRDNHLKSDDFFNAASFPKMKFESTEFKKVSDDKYKLKGNLTIRDVTKEVVFDVNFGGKIIDPYGMTRAGFSAKTSIDRFDYGLKFNATTESGGLIAGRKVDITVNVEMVKQS